MIENNRLKKAIRLARRVAVYVPATAGPATAADNGEEVRRAAALLSGLFGGATIQPGAGCWMSDEAGLVTEATTLVYAFTDDAGLAAGIDPVLDFAEAIKAEMQQESVAVEINGELFLM